MKHVDPLTAPAATAQHASQDASITANLYTLDAAALRAEHHLEAGRPEPTVAWQQLDALLPWLDDAHAHCLRPSATVAKAAEWLLDNEFQLRRAVRQLAEDLPPAFYRRLPRLAGAKYHGIPRVLALARGMLVLRHVPITLGGVVEFVNAYQQAGPLTIAELWALPAMLRLACIEETVQSLGELLPALTSPFTAGASQNSKRRAHALADASLDVSGLAIAAPAEVVSRAISSLVAVSAIPWAQFFEQTSQVEVMLRTDPAGIYGAMDFDTRDRYRKAVEEISEHSNITEWDLATKAVALARAHTKQRRVGHVGYWLVAEGRAQLEQQVGFRPSWRIRWRRRLLARPGRSYAGALVCFSLLALLIPLGLLHHGAASTQGWLVGLLLSLAPAMIIGVTCTHWVVSRSVAPRVLPKLAVDQGLQPGWNTALVMPVILRHPTEVDSLLERLERHWLSNPDPLVRMALLSDLADADTEQLAIDALIEAALVAGVRRLNSRYSEQAPFSLLHRRRLWNPAEGRWMGWERKRGKLEELVCLILGHQSAAFSLQEGDIAALCQARFVVTLDADTRAQPNDINRLIATLAHPLNRVQFDPVTGRPTCGYTFIQPRVEISPDAGGRSPFTRLYSGDTAIDIYSCAVSDVYQDLFGEGIFTGKGAFDVAAFHQCLHDRVPENAILSHDLFEGLHGRAALASDIVFYEDFPDNYLSYARRALRWIRGDWQLMPWLVRQVPSRSEPKVSSRFSALDRWKMLDNLRRSLVAPMLVAFASLAWLLLPGHALIWTLLAVGAPGVYLIIELITRLVGVRKPGAMRSILHPFTGHVGRWLLAVTFLAHEAAVAMEAIGRALWRLWVSRKKMLEWTSAAHAASEVAHTWQGTWREMAAAPLFAVTMTALLAWLNPGALSGAAPLLLLWFISPHLAWFISQERQPLAESLNKADRQYLRLIARRTWLYFETFAGPDDNWLVPDNYQAAPHEELAHRSSPTNVGMLLLAALTAWDLGHIGRRDLAARMAAALDALDRLESHEGHTVNWFNTRTLESLTPRYISTVDSGNLAVSLLTLSAGCREAAAGALWCGQSWDGLEDVLRLLQAALLSGAEASDPTPETELTRRRRALYAQLEGMIEHLAHTRAHGHLWQSALQRLNTEQWPPIKIQLSQVWEAGTAAGFHEIPLWLKRTDHHLMTMQRDLEALAPWLALVATAPCELPGMAALLKSLPQPHAALADVSTQLEQARAQLAKLTAVDASTQQWLADLAQALTKGEAVCQNLHQGLLQCAARAHARAFAMNFSSLYDSQTSTFFIGHNLDTGHLDPHHYDLLASEARLASYFAIAKRDVPVKHWFHLGRPVSRAGGALSLLSWNGSMFEYLMPALLLPSEAGRLLGQSERAAVRVQQRYGDKLGLPWGVSESGFAARNDAQHYQYQAFGVPGLGLKHGLANDYVVAPYASALALSVAPIAATANLRRLDKLGLRDRYGFFEAVDFTPERLACAGSFSAVRSYMAHHQGMICAAIGNALHDDILVRRFTREPQMRATELLLQERVPWEAPCELSREHENKTPNLTRLPTPQLPSWTSDESLGPQLHVLGNGHLAAWVTQRGESSLWWRDQAVTGWSCDALCSGGAARIYLSQQQQDGAQHKVWSLGQDAEYGSDHPASGIRYHGHQVEFHAHRAGLVSHLEVTLAANDDVEFRRVTLTNDSDQVMELVVTSYAEVVLAPLAAYQRHPAFSKLFIHSEHISEHNALLFERRTKEPEEQPPVLLHRLLTGEASVVASGFETDRRQFLGRHGNLAQPKGASGALSGTCGWTLDPVMALQARVSLAPGAQTRLDFVTAVASTRDAVLALALRFSSSAALDWAIQDAPRTTALEAQRLGLDGATLAQAQAWCGELLFARTPPILLLASEPSLPAQPHLWSMGLSGDVPMILVRVADPTQAPLLPPLIRMHRWWQRCGLAVDLVFLQEGASGYQAPVRELLFAALRDANIPEGLGGKGGIHLLAAERIGALERRTLKATARVAFDASAPSLATLLAVPRYKRTPLPNFQPLGAPSGAPLPATPLLRPINLAFDNALGGFMPDSHDYLIHLAAGQVTPAPWCNVLANERFGTLVSEAGLGFTWSINSGEHRLTPWSNDPVRDPQTEALYLRDEETAQIWTPTPLPAGGGEPCQIQHQAGATIWRRHGEGLEQQLKVGVPPTDPVKLVLLSLTNPGVHPRRVTVTYYAQWQLGAEVSDAAPYLVCGFDAQSQALVARNDWHPEFAGRTAFLAASRPAHSLSCDREAFLGLHQDPARPAGLVAWSLDGALDNVADPCAAFQVHLDLAPGATEEVVFVLGEGRDLADARLLAMHWANLETAKLGLADNQATWQQRLQGVQVSTPDPALDVMVNRWLPQQNLASRILARAGFQQAGGAVGFRDQLQDMLALLFSDPQRVREHILACAARQFEEGDVLHWWHPPLGRGVKTHFSDDLLWLVYATGRYVSATGDRSILHERVPFLSASPLAKGEADRYALFEAADESGTLFEHCRRALNHGVTAGVHGLPLMGSGDWNDGMNRVGDQGRGESVWLAWFASSCAEAFANLALEVERTDLHDHWRTRAEQLRQAADAAGWDGAWYVRAFDDDGLAWGSKNADECQIDSIAQSWAVLAAGSSPERAAQAVQAATERLLDREARLIRLLTPPFAHTQRDPGYICAYPPGVRENGGQYTHAAAWLGLAHVRLGNGNQAYEIFDLINPIRRSAQLQGAEHYRGEPYVLAADIRGAGPNTGNAGWTWYTGAAGWTWQLAVEGLLGLTLQGGALNIAPCLPTHWGRASARIKGPNGVLVITIEDPERLGTGHVELTLDDQRLAGKSVAFPTDGSERQVIARLCQLPQG